jgi:Ca2+-binding RTX toxin-like protein
MPAARVIDLSFLSPSQGFIIQGDASGDYLGSSVSSAGDVNGDGIDDLIVGAPWGDNGGSYAGEAYVIFGKAGGLSDIDLSSLFASDGFIIQGDTASDEAGGSVSFAGDVNGDGIDDLIVGASSGDYGASYVGEAYVIFGKTTGFSNIDLSTLSPAEGFIIGGDAAFDRTGLSVSSVGDVNGDGIDDLIVGAPRGDNGGRDAGEAYVIFGKTTGFSNIDLSTLSPANGFIIQGERASDWAGFSVSSAGDVNGDGIDDLIVGAPRGGNGGEAYVIFGKTTGFSNIALAALSPADGFTIQGDAAGDNLGWSVSSAGDVNGDGIDDLIVGEPGGNDGGNYAGEAYVIFGRAAGTRADIDLSTLSAGDGFTIQGDVAYNHAGFSVASAGDINGDGIDDLIVGAPFGDYGANNTGEAYVIFGKTTGFSNIDLTSLSAADGFIIQGDAADDFAGKSVSSAGDVNGDGIDDLIVGAPRGGNGGSYAGEAYVIFGSKSIGVVPWNFSYAEPTDMLLFAQFAVDAYNGTGKGRVSDVVDAPTGWTAFLSTDDGETSPRYPGGIGGLAIFDTSPGSGELAAMQATAYTDASGRVVIAYRGTDDGLWEELAKTSFTLGAGENVGNARAYLQTAVNFYEAVVASGVDPSQISFAGHSLGGIVAGYLAGITGSQAMIFASGPQSLLYERLDGLVSKGTDMGYVTGAPDTSGISHMRIDGEVLGESVDLAKAYGPKLIGELVSRLGGPLLGGLAELALDARYGDASVWGTQLAEFTSGDDLSSLFPSTDLHRMQLHLTMLAAEKELGFTSYKNIPGFLSGLFDDDLAKSIQTGTIGPVYAAPRDLGSQMFSDITLTYGGERPDVLTPLLTQAETLIAPLATVRFGLLFTFGTTGYDRYSAQVATTLSQLLIEAAARSLHDGAIDFDSDTGLARVGAGLDWLSIDLSGFGTAGSWYGLDQFSDLVLAEMGRGSLTDNGNVEMTTRINLATEVVVFSPDGGIDGFTGTGANELIIGGVYVDGTGVALDGAGGDDVLIGGRGSDALSGGSGKNVLLGGLGNDTYYASGVTGARTLIADSGGNDRLYVDGTLPQLNAAIDRYGDGDLSLSINGGAASVEILDFFGVDALGVPLRKGPGHIESIFDGSGTKYAIAIGVEKVIGIAKYSFGKLKSGVENVAVAARDTVDKFVGKLSDFSDKALNVLGFGEEDSFTFSKIGLNLDNFTFTPGSLIVDIDTDLDGVTDASFKLEGDFADFDVSLKVANGNTVFRVIERAVSKYDIYGTSADETVKGTAGADRLGGLDGNDKLVGNRGKDVLYGGDGNDRLVGGKGTDELFGGRGSDVYVISDITDKVFEYAGQGKDTVLSWVDYTLTVNVENLTLKGRNSISGTGNSLDNLIVGNDQNNTLSGLAGDDTIKGKGGDDQISGGSGDDALIGGAGFDYADYANAAASVDVNLLTGTATGGDGIDTLSELEGIIGSEFSDTLRGDNLVNTVLAGAGDDLVLLAGGKDYAEGGAGNDTLKGGTGADTLLGGSGADTINGQGGNDNIAGGLGDDTLAGNGGFDLVNYSKTVSAVNVDLAAGTATGGDGTDTLSGFEGIIGSAYADVLSGNTGKNTIRAGAGNDTLKGLAGSDKLFGGNGADTLNGGTGNDRLTGGAGADAFVFNGGLAEGTDRILDFADGIDIMRITGATFGDLTIAAAAGGTDTQITFASGTVAILTGVDVSLIDAGDFVFL